MLAIDKSPVHGTAVAVDGRGFLFLGDSGRGKSGLALSMMALGAALISDDQVLLTATDHGVELSAPATLRGKIEARHVGILETNCASHAALTWVVDLNAETQTRMPQLQYCDVLGHRFGLINGRNVPNLASILMILGRGARLS